MRLLDCGCGPGTITVGLADAVHPSQVVRARRLAHARGLKNLEFTTGSVYELPVSCPVV